MLKNNSLAKRYNRLQSYSLCNNMEETQMINLLSKVQVMQNMKKRYKNISLTEENYFRLGQLGKVPESFNTIVGRLLAEHFGNRDNNVAKSGSGLDPRARLATGTTPSGEGIGSV